MARFLASTVKTRRRVCVCVMFVYGIFCVKQESK